MTKDICAAAIEILRATNDGDDLDPAHLKLVEMAVNGFLSPEIRDAFDQLHSLVRSGYAKPWLHDVTHMTIDHEGYVYWKSHRIEHFSRPYATSDKAKIYTVELARNCAELEARGETPTFAALSPAH